MTAQTSEFLIHEGRIEQLHSLPLDPYLESRGIGIRAISNGHSTALWRGYIGFWEVFDDELFLIGLLDFLNQPINPATVFGDRRFPIKADWFSGRLEIDRGERLSYVHMGWCSQYAQRLRLHIKQARVVAQRSYDQRKLLLRRYKATYEAEEEFRRLLAEKGSSELGPLGGFTEAGLKVLGWPAVEGREPWPCGLTDEELAQMVEPWLLHCTRPGPTGH
jgi:hypothetical protein